MRTQPVDHTIASVNSSFFAQSGVLNAWRSGEHGASCTPAPRRKDGQMKFGMERRPPPYRRGGPLGMTNRKR